MGACWRRGSEQTVPGLRTSAAVAVFFLTLCRWCFFWGYNFKVSSLKAVCYAFRGSVLSCAEQSSCEYLVEGRKWRVRAGRHLKAFWCPSLLQLIDWPLLYLPTPLDQEILSLAFPQPPLQPSANSRGGFLVVQCDEAHQ